MASSPVPHVRITRDGVAAPAPVSTADFSTLTIPDNDGNKTLVLVNSSGVDATVEVVPQQTYGGLALANQVCLVPAGTTRHFGPWPPALFNDDDLGAVEIIAGTGALSLYSLGI